MSAYRFVKVTAFIETAARSLSVTTPLRVPPSIAKLVSVPGDSLLMRPLADAIAKAELVRAGLLTPGEATTATFSYASV